MIYKPHDIDYRQPLELDAPLNQDIICSYIVLPKLRGGLKWYNLVHHGYLQGTFVDMATSAWQHDAPPGGCGSIDFNAGYDPGDHIITESSTVYQVGQTGDPGMTFGMWIKFDSTGLMYVMSCEKDGNDGVTGWSLGKSGDWWFWYWGETGGTDDKTQSAFGTGPPANQWIYVMVTAHEPSGVSRIYEYPDHGLLKDDTGFTDIVYSATSTLAIGNRGADLFNDGLQGLVSEFSYWGRAFTEAECDALYLEAVRGYPTRLRRFPRVFGIAPAGGASYDDSLTIAATSALTAAPGTTANAGTTLALISTLASSAVPTIPASTTLAMISTLAAGADATGNAGTTLALISTLAAGADATGNAAVTLAAIAALAQSPGTTVDESITLAGIATLVAAGGLSVQDALTLAAQSGLTPTVDATAAAALTLAAVSTLAAGADATAEGALTLAEVVTLTTAADAAAEGSLTLSAIATLVVAGGLSVQDALTLAASAGLSTVELSTLIGSLTLSSVQTVSTSAQATSSPQMALAAISQLAAAAAATVAPATTLSSVLTLAAGGGLALESALTLAVQQAVSVDADATAEAALTLAATLTEAFAAGQDVDASIELAATLTAAAVVDATLESAVAISSVHTFSWGATGGVIGITTLPDPSRWLIAKVDLRTLSVSIEDTGRAQTYKVPADDPEIQVQRGQKQRG